MATVVAGPTVRLATIAAPEKKSSRCDDGVAPGPEVQAMLSVAPAAAAEMTVACPGVPPGIGGPPGG
jgi:hypothetical protein